MQVADYIHRHGFRRWYERQLVESHAYLALAFVAMILMLAGLEVLSEIGGAARYVAVLCAAALGGTLMLVAWRRFNTLLARAVHFSEMATCPSCQSWGKFRVVSQESTLEEDPPESGRPHWLKVRCNKCTHEWRIG